MAAGSFSAGLSGLSANQTYLSVIGNNLANINTVGYKASAVNFADLVSQNVGGISQNPMQIGLGVTTGSISPVFSQGGIENSGVSTNAAIQGNGFFIVSNGQSTAYTRAGNFSFDANGYLTTPDGWRVQGYTTIDPTTGNVIPSTAGDILIPPGALRPPVATTSFTAQINLKADEPITTNPEYQTSVKVYDSKGGAHVLSLVFERTGTGAWTYSVNVPTSEITTGATGTTTLTTGALAFDANGNLTTPANPTDITIPTTTWANGGTNPAITWDVYKAGSTAANLTSYVTASAAGSLTQNGAPSGQVDSVNINSDGEIVATLGGGGSVVVGQLALANFNNAQGLVKLGSNRYGESQAAGVANIGVAGTGGRGSVTGSALEGSNVDIAQEFTKMILAQRGYQANSRSITTADEVLQETINMKR
jgi:flagellar hook protein FlgE